MLVSKLQGSYCGAALRVSDHQPDSLHVERVWVHGATGPKEARDLWSGRNSGKGFVPSLPTLLAGTLDKVPAVWYIRYSTIISSSLYQQTEPFTPISYT